MVEHNQTVPSVVSQQLAKEVEAGVFMAKKFPRDEINSQLKIDTSCKRLTLAKQAEYTYPRGGQQITGPSIRLMEVIAQGWGNIAYGTLEVDRKDGASQMLAYAWDLENNLRSTRLFHVKHVRDTKFGSKELKDERDIYETTANMGSRRVRACLMGIIPGDVIEDAQIKCRKTVAGGYDKPLVDRTRDIVQWFANKFSVSKEQIEEYIGYNVLRFNEQDFLKLQGVSQNLKDGISSREDFFKFKEPEQEESPFVLAGKKRELEKKNKKEHVVDSIFSKTLDDVNDESELEQKKLGDEK